MREEPMGERDSTEGGEKRGEVLEREPTGDSVNGRGEARLRGREWQLTESGGEEGSGPAKESIGDSVKGR